MQHRALQIAEEIEADATARPAGAGGRRDDRAAALAGRRALHLPRLPRVRAPDRGGRRRRPAASPCRAAGWASCARTRPSPVTPAGCRARSRRWPGSGSCCVVTKANSRSTVHRPAYLDYVGVKTFDDGRRGRGGAPVPRAVHLGGLQREHPAHPGAAPQGRGGAGAQRVQQQQPLRQGPAADPGDLPARRAVPDRQRRPGSHRAERACTCRSAGSCGCSCAATTTAGSCPAWSTCRGTATRPRCATRMEAILLEAFDGTSIDYTALVSESVLARLHFVVRVDPSHAVPDVDPAEVEAELVLATRSWDDDFARRAARTAAASRRRPGCADVYGDAFPEAYKEDLPAADAVADLHRLEALSQRRRHRPAALRAAPAPSAGRPPAQAVPRRRAGLAVAGAAAAAGDGCRGRRRAALRDRADRPAGGLGLRLRPALRAVRRAARRRRPAACSRTRSPPSGRATPRATASTRWCCGPG